MPSFCEEPVLQDAIAVYDKVDYIKVLPETALARLGGDAKSVHPKGYQQLEAIAFAKEKDGKIPLIQKWPGRVKSRKNCLRDRSRGVCFQILNDTRSA